MTRTFRLNARRFVLATCLCGLLSGLPSPARATWPVVDWGLIGLFTTFYYAQVAQWQIENSSRGNTNGLLSGTQQGVVEATVRAAQGGVDQQVWSNYAMTSRDVARKYGYTKDNHLCPLVYQTNYMDEAADGKAAVVEALNKTIRWIGSGGDNPDADLKLLDTLCKMNLMPLNQAGGLVHKLCTMKISGFEGRAMEANSVSGPFQYTFPSNIRKDKKTGILMLEEPRTEDMPGIAALFYCVLTHPLTELPPISDTRAPSVGDAVMIVKQMRQQLLSNPSGDLCVSALAERMAVPASAPTDELIKVHKAQANFCIQANHTGCMDDDAKNECVKNGMSALNMARYLACRSGNPACATKNLVGRGFGSEEVTKELMQGPNACAAFLEKKRASDAQFISGMSETFRASYFAPSVSPTARQMQ